MGIRIAAITVLVWTLVQFAAAQVSDLGGEFELNVPRANVQAQPVIFWDANEDLTAIWDDNVRDASGWGIYGRRFDAFGNATGSEFRVNSNTQSNQRFPAIAGDPSGAFVVVWQSNGEDGDGYGVFGQRYSSSGNATGTEFRVNDVTTNGQIRPRVAMDGQGGFVVAWADFARDGDNFGIFARRFASDGTPAGGAFQVNTYTTGAQLVPDIAGGSAGNFVVVWQSADEDGDSSGIFGQRFTSGGDPAGTEFQVNAYTTGPQVAPSVASLPDGGFVVAWSSYGADGYGYGYGISARRFDSAGAPDGTEFRVNELTTGDQTAPRVATDAGGDFVVAWQSNYGDGQNIGIFARRFDASGAALTDEFQVNTYTTGSEYGPALAVIPSGYFAVAWTSSSEDSGGPTIDGSAAVFAQRFDVPTTSTTTTSSTSTSAGSPTSTTVTQPSATTTTLIPASARQTLSAKSLMLRDAPNPLRRSFALNSKDGGVALGGGAGTVDDPTATGATFRLRGTGFDHTYGLPATRWHRVGARGWRYRDATLSAGPIAAIDIRRGKSVAAAGHGAALDISLAVDPTPVEVDLQIGLAGHMYCLRFAGPHHFKAKRSYAARNASAPADCAP